MSAMAIVEQPVEEPTPDVSAAEIAREIGNDGELKRKSKVVAFTDLPGVPEGTPGRVALVNGWGPWIRYHVLFDNGVDLGSINREHLAPAKKYERFRQRREQALASGVFDRVEEEESDAGEAGEAAATGGDAPVVNGVTVPQYLIERSKAARERLGA